MFRNQSVDTHSFAMIPRADIPRSSFRIQKAHKTTFDAGYLIPVYVDEILPGDSFNVKMTAFARMATPVFPIMDNLTMDSFFFFVPCRLVWNNWEKFMGQQTNPSDSISYAIPQVTSVSGGYVACGLGDYFGLPTQADYTGTNQVTNNVLPFRAYNLIWNEWFRDENLQNSTVVNLGDGPDNVADYGLLRRGKRHDYFTSCLPWTQKGTAVTLPLGTSAPVRTSVSYTVTGSQQPLNMLMSATGNVPPANTLLGQNAGSIQTNAATAANTGNTMHPGNLYADLSQATAATINQIRQAFQIQKLLERDARGGTRYTEIVRSHFGVISPDARLQRPEYLGGGSSPVSIVPVERTAPPNTISTAPQGTLAAYGTLLAHEHGFNHSFTEHGYVIGLVSIRADLTYQQGMRRMWSRQTRYDFYWPVFSHLGEQPVYNREIYWQGSAADGNVFGYQERWAEYRYNPSLITGFFRSTNDTSIDQWHLAQNFTALPTLNSTFIQDTPPVARVVAAGTQADGQQFLWDSFFDIKAARPLPMYGVPGLVDHF